MLFSFTTPAKFCFRAMALFCKYVTGALPPHPLPMLDKDHIVASPPETPPASPKFPNFRRALSLSGPGRSTPTSKRQSSTMGHSKTVSVEVPRMNIPFHLSSSPISTMVACSRVPVRTTMGGAPPPLAARIPHAPLLNTLLAGPDMRANHPFIRGASSLDTPDTSPSPFIDNMIRERVSMHGEIRPLEPEEDLFPCNMPIESIA